MTLPINFLYLGGDKCGSTWMHNILSQHPDVVLAKSKELFYFDRYYEKGSGWYSRQFPANSKAARVGEICHDYLYSDTALSRIARDTPKDCRYIIVTRDPVSRTLSHYKYLRKIGKTNLPIDVALKSLPQLIEHSLFGKYVSQAQEILGHERVYIIEFETLKQDPSLFGKELMQALGIDFLPDLPYSKRILEAESSRNPYVVNILRNLGWMLRNLGAPGLVSFIKSSTTVRKLLYTPVDGTDRSLEIDEATKGFLENTFSEDQDVLREIRKSSPACS